MHIVKMNPEVKTKWVAALRSGEYEQGKGRLHQYSAFNTRGRFCCLGVLCDVAVKSGLDLEIRPVGSGHGYAEASLTLPRAVAEWAGLDQVSPGVQYEGGYECLDSLNDADVPFGRIADLIEEQL